MFIQERKKKQKQRCLQSAAGTRLGALLESCCHPSQGSMCASIRWEVLMRCWSQHLGTRPQTSHHRLGPGRDMMWTKRRSSRRRGPVAMHSVGISVSGGHERTVHAVGSCRWGVLIETLRRGGSGQERGTHTNDAPRLAR